MSTQAGALQRVIPNVLTAARLPLALTFLLVRTPEARVAVIVAAGLTDAADGLLARRWGTTSRAGAVLDGIADKAFTLTVLITLVAEARLQVWAPGMIVLRDVVVMGIATIAIARRAWWAFGMMSARFLGKLATLWIFPMLIVGVWLPEIPLVLSLGAGVTCVLAAVEYALIARRALRAGPAMRRHPPPENS
ncbi:MAG: CDP-alcohol phosphatidyltransferase family protein [Phycisphaeraceae bacterium]|nr:CDP-alcohol phosphatidyltransferase family protein [Phycisphaeraceae bacterium]